MNTTLHYRVYINGEPSIHSLRVENISNQYINQAKKHKTDSLLNDYPLALIEFKFTFCTSH